MWAEIRVPKEGFTSSDPRTDIPPNAMITGSKNMMYRGEMELESVGGWKLTQYGGLSSNRGGDVSFLLDKGWAIIGDQLNEGSGSIVEFIGRSLWFVGTGDITVYQQGITATPQALGNSPLQNGIPQVAVLNGSKNGYSAPVQIGLLEELNAPVLRALSTPGAGFQGLMTGTYSIQITHIRASTGAESLASPSSNVITLSNQSVIIRFPVTPTNAALHGDKWRIYGTKSGFGAVGPYFFFIDIPIRRVTTENNGTVYPASTGYAVEDSGGGVFNLFRQNPTVSGGFTTEQVGKRLVLYDNTNAIIHTATITGVDTNLDSHHGTTHGDKIIFTPAYSGTTSNTDRVWQIDTAQNSLVEYEYETEWNDTDLAAIQPPVDTFPPATTALFIVALVNVMVLVGTEDGNGVAVSVPNFPEAYPPDYRLNLPETPIGVLSRPQDGYFIILCNNSVHEVRWTGAVDGAPVSVRTIAEQIGALNQKAAAQAGNDIYLYTSSHKAGRILSNGVVDMSFGDRVESEMKTWMSGDVSVSYDEKRNYVMYAYQDRFLLYFPAYNSWTPLIYPVDQETAARPVGTIESMFTKDGVIHQSFYSTENPTVSITMGTNIVNTTTFTFTHMHLGKIISIPGADSGGNPLVAVITNINASNQVTISATAVNTVSEVLSGIAGFDMWTFDRDTADAELNFSTSWVIRYSFSDYGVGLNPKTVHKVKAGMKTTAGTYSLNFYRNYDLVTQMGATRSFTATGGNHITKIIDTNNGEAEMLSVQLSGTGVRDKVHFLKLEGDDYGIDTNYGV